MPVCVQVLLSSGRLGALATSLEGHFPGEPVPVLSHPLGEELFPSIKPKTVLTKLHTVLLILSLVTRVKRQGKGHPELYLQGDKLGI